MPSGYLVQLGDGSLDVNDSIVDPLTSFSTDTIIGSGDWVWSGTYGGRTYTNTSEPGVYYLATNGNIYFVPDYGPVNTISSASVEDAPAYSTTDGVVNGTSGDDVIDDSFTDGDGDVIDGGDGSGPAGNEDFVEAGAGNDSVASGLENDTVYGEAGMDTLDGGSGNDLLGGGGGNDTLLGGDGDDTLYGGADTSQFTGTGGTNASSTSFQVISLGNAADIDPNETNGVSENAADLFGSYGSTGEPLYNSLLDVITSDPNGSGNVDDNDNGNTPETITIGGVAKTVDSVQVYNATLTYTDGTTAAISAVVFQTTDGEVYWAPELASNADSAAMSAKPIESVTLTSINADNGSLAADRIDTDYKIPVPDGSDDVLDGGAGNDELHGDQGNDTLTGGTGADTLYGGLGDDEMYLAEGDEAYGGDGDDLFVLGNLNEAGSSTITIVGGEGGETVGDTLQLNAEVTPDDITFTNTDDAAGGLSGTFTMADGTVVNFSEIENIICFTPGTRILTEHGERAIETLRAGDRIMTRDSGLQPIRWIGHSTVEGRGKFAPIAVNSTVLDGARRPLLVSPQHRLLFTGYKAELLFGEPEVFVAAKHLVNGLDVRVAERDRITYFHLMLERHEVIYAEGAGTESFHPNDLGVAAISPDARTEMFDAFPQLRLDLRTYGDTARPCLKAHEARLLFAPVFAAAA